jgi:DNA-binding response OmpR family regulator
MALEEHEVTCEMNVIADGESAISYIEALDAMDVPCPVLVILDLNLPRRPGLHVLAAVRRTLRFSAVPVVVLSSSEAVQDKEAATRLGATGYLKKPTRLEEFLGLGAVFKSMIGP